MLVIRLARTGKKKQAYFRIIISDKRRAVGAKFVDVVGNYDPHSKKTTLDSEKLTKYIEKGAQPSNTVAKLLAKEDFKLPKWVKITEKVKKKKGKKGAASAAAEKTAGAAEKADETQNNAEKTEESKEAKTESNEEPKEDNKDDKKVEEVPAEENLVEKEVSNKSEESTPEKVESGVEKE